MSRQQRLIRLSVIGTILLCLLAEIGLLAWKRFSKKTPPTKIAKHKVETPSDETLKYWTANKMRDAKATPLHQVDNLRREKPHSRDE